MLAFPFQKQSLFLLSYLPHCLDHDNLHTVYIQTTKRIPSRNAWSSVIWHKRDGSKDMLNWNNVIPTFGRLVQSSTPKLFKDILWAFCKHLNQIHVDYMETSCDELLTLHQIPVKVSNKRQVLGLHRVCVEQHSEEEQNTCIIDLVIVLGRAEAEVLPPHISWN